MSDKQDPMQCAIDKAREGILQGQSPFGACIVLDGKIVACCHNQVWQHNDITAHAEVLALREACKALGTIDLTGALLYSTCEPCPMCFSAIHWAKVSKIFYGASISDAQALGFNELTVSNVQMKDLGGSPVEIVPKWRREDCLRLFQEFADLQNPKIY